MITMTCGREGGTGTGTGARTGARLWGAAARNEVVVRAGALRRGGEVVVEAGGAGFEVTGAAVTAGNDDVDDARVGIESWDCAGSKVSRFSPAEEATYSEPITTAQKSRRTGTAVRPVRWRRA